jgi:hypothetical protein
MEIACVENEEKNWLKFKLMHLLEGRFLLPLLISNSVV